MGRDPDEDVVFMSHATHFIQGGGGFSRLIGGLVRHMGGEVFENCEFLHSHELKDDCSVGKKPSHG